MTPASPLPPLLLSIHVPKTAGTSLDRLLATTFGSHSSPAWPAKSRTFRFFTPYFGR